MPTVAANAGFSGVDRVYGVQEVAGSNPAGPTSARVPTRFGSELLPFGLGTPVQTPTRLTAAWPGTPAGPPPAGPSGLAPARPASATPGSPPTAPPRPPAAAPHGSARPAAPPRSRPASTATR